MKKIKHKKRLNEFIDTLEDNDGFDRGNRDCVMFSMKAVEKMTGWLPGSNKICRDGRSVNEYNSLSEGIKNIKSNWDGLEDLVDEIMSDENKEEIHPNFMQCGDICIMKDSDDPVPAIGVYDGSKIVSMSKNGIQYYSVNQSKRAWRI